MQFAVKIIKSIIHYKFVGGFYSICIMFEIIFCVLKLKLALQFISRKLSRGICDFFTNSNLRRLFFKIPQVKNWVKTWEMKICYMFYVCLYWKWRWNWNLAHKSKKNLLTKNNICISFYKFVTVGLKNTLSWLGNNPAS